VGLNEHNSLCQTRAPISMDSAEDQAAVESHAAADPHNVPYHSHTNILACDARHLDDVYRQLRYSSSKSPQHWRLWCPPVCRRSLDKTRPIRRIVVLYNDSFKWLDCFAETAIYGIARSRGFLVVYACHGRALKETRRTPMQPHRSFAPGT
jgi:hypothetical protein